MRHCHGCLSDGPIRVWREGIANEFEEAYRFNYLFAENGVVYLAEDLISRLSIATVPRHALRCAS